jgi:hypothetical protein
MGLIIRAVTLEQFGVIYKPLEAHFALECDFIVLVVIRTGNAYLSCGVPVIRRRASHTAGVLGQKWLG